MTILYVSSANLSFPFLIFLGFQGLLIASILCQGPAVTLPTTRNPAENTTQASNTTQRPSSNAIDTAKDVVANSSMTGQVKTSGNGALILKASKDGDNKSEIVLANVTAAPVLAPNGTLVKSNTTGLNATDLTDDVILAGNKTSKVVVVPVDTNNKTNRVNQVIVQLNHRSIQSILAIWTRGRQKSK